MIKTGLAAFIFGVGKIYDKHCLRMNPHAASTEQDSGLFDNHTGGLLKIPVG